MKVKALCCAALLGLLVGPAMAASVPMTVYISPDCQTFDSPGGSTTVDIVADIPEENAIIGYGIDLVLSGDPVVTPIGVTIGSAFDTVPTIPDGDGLAGMVQPSIPLYGNGIVLATVELSLDAEGTAWLTPGYTATDLTEGFMTSGGFVTEIEWIPGCIVVPEPATMLLLALGALLRRR